jgi:translocation and assembly module TamB
MRRWLLRLAFGVLVLAVALVLSLRTRPVRAWLLAQAIAAVEGGLDARVSIGALHGPVLRTFVLEDVRIRTGGETIVHAPRVEVAYDLLPLLGGSVRIDRLVLDRPRIRLVRTDGAWILPASRSSGEGGSADLTLNGIRVRGGRVAVALLDAERSRRLAVTALDLDAAARLGGDGQAVDVAALRFVPRGIALRPVQASAAITAATDGRIRVARLDVTTGRSRLGVSGRVEPGVRVDARATLSPLAAADVRALLPDLDLRADARTRVRARGAWQAIDAVARVALAPGGGVDCTARINAAATPLRYRLQAALAALDPGAALAGLPRASVTGRLDVEGVGTGPAGLRRYTAGLHDSAIEGRAVDRLMLTGRSDGTAHRVRGNLIAPLGQVTIDARATLGEPLAYAARADYTIARLEEFVPSTWGWLAGTARVRGRGTAPGARRATGRLHLRSAAVQGLPIDRARLRAGLEREHLAVERLAVVSRDVGIDVKARGGIGLGDREVVADATVTADLGAVGRYLGQPLAGALTASATAQGRPETLAVRATGDVRRPAYGSFSAEQLRVKAEARDAAGPAATGTVELTAAAARAGTQTAYATRGTSGWRRQAGADRVDVVLAAEAEDGTRQRVAATIERAPDRILTTVRDLHLTPPEGPPWRLAGPAVVRIDDAATLDDLTLTSGRQRVGLRGRLALREGTSDATITLGDVELAPACAATSGAKCGGRVSARIGVTGTPAAPVVALGLDGRALAVGEIAYGDLDAEGRYVSRRLKVGAALRHPDAGTMRLQGEVPVDLAWAGARADLSAAPLSLALRAERLDLAFVQALAPRVVKSIAGRVAVDLGVTGTRAIPRIRGDAALTGGRLELVATGIAYENVHARLAADGTRLVLHDLHAEAGEGSADVAGSIELATPPRTLDVALRLREFFAVRQRSYEAAVSGDVRIGGSVEAPDVSGRVVVDRAMVRPAMLPASEPTVPDDPTIVVVGRPVAAAEAAPAPGPPIGESVRVAVRIEIERNAWIRRSDADIEIGGTLEVTKSPDHPLRIVGEIQLLRGWYEFQGRRLTLEPGSRIVFTGATPPEPTLDVTAIHTTRDYRIQVRLSGSIEKPTLDLSSTPPLEQADILAVLLFGKPVQALGSGESMALQQKAVALAAGYAVPELRTSVLNTFGLETFDVELPEGETPGKVSAGRYLAEDVFVSIGQEFGRRAAQIVGVEYYVGRNVSVRASTSTRGDSALDLLWRYRY